jgi:hypothetical protein
MKISSENVKAILAFVIVVMGFSYFFAITFFETVNSDPQIIIAIVGLMTVATGYYYNSTSSSSKKDETIQRLTEKK